MDEIQYTYKPSKLILILSFMKTKDMFFENLKPVKPKLKTILTCVCELEHSKTNYLYTRSKNKTKQNKLKSSCRVPSPSRLDPNTIQRA